MSSKVVFLAFANDRNNPLPTLTKEDQGIYGVLVSDVLNGKFHCHRESFATVEAINTFLGKYGDQIAIFHFSGHAGPGELLIDNVLSNAAGIPAQLRDSIRSGTLKLVILNGCSTKQQVGAFLKAETTAPAVIATRAPVEDESAAFFGIRFFQNLSEKQMTIEEAFLDALGPAQLATSSNLGVEDKTYRDIDFFDQMPEDKPIWELFALSREAVDLNPLPAGASRSSSSYLPNKELFESIFSALLNAGNSSMEDIAGAEAKGKLIYFSDKQREIVNALPFPIGTHLLKLFTPSDHDSFVDIGPKRIAQLTEVFHISMELMAFVMLAQLWELKLSEQAAEIPEDLLEKIREFFYLTSTQRSNYDYMPLIRKIRLYFDSLNEGQGIQYFISELANLRIFAAEGHPFADACVYLTTLRNQVIQKKIRPESVQELCERAEKMLATFFFHTGFLHLYIMTSIQDIDIFKPRHNLKAKFIHLAINLMRAQGKPDQLYYRLDSYLDNQGVILLKGNLNLVDIKKRLFQGSDLKFLNLSPFVIDRNIFEENTNLTNPMFFDGYNRQSRTFNYKNVRKSDSKEDRLEIDDNEKYLVLRSELEAFIHLIRGGQMVPNP